MNVLLVFAISLAVFYVGAKLYGPLTAKWLGEDPSRPTPAVEINDGREYVPTNMNVLFGHHFATIAGAGPIVGPTVAILFGYMPVWAWVVFGAVFIGAVHDFAALFTSIRERGRSIAEITRTTLGTTGFFLFICFAILLLTLVTSAFLVMTVQALVSTAPLAQLGLEPGQTILQTVVKGGVTHGVIGGIASTSVIVVTLFAPLLGYLIYKRNLNTAAGYALAAVVALASIKIGLEFPVTFNPKVWMLVLAVYVTFAATLPVWIILQPRDFTNVQILYVGIIAMFVVIIVGGFQGVSFQTASVAIETGNAKLGSIWPFLFITVACGAVSGFHALVSTGTTSKQLAKEGQARKVGYNAMILEGIVAVGTVIVVGAGLSQQQYLNIVWPAPGAGGSNPILAFALGMGVLLNKTMSVPTYFGSVFGILLVEGFVVTTLDSAIRLNRYLFEELWNILFKGKVPAVMQHASFNSGLAVLLMLWLAWNNAFTALWPMFASCNQLLAALALLAVSSWLLKRRRQAWFTMLPAIFMIVTTMGALFMLFTKYWTQTSALLAKSGDISGPATLLVMDILCIGLAVGVVVMATQAFLRFRSGQVETPAD